MSNAFDTLKLADRLESAGFTQQQARGAALPLSETMTASLATKADLAEMRSDLKAEIAKQGSDLKAEIAVVRSDTLILKWMTGFLLALAVAVAMKLFVH